MESHLDGQQRTSSPYRLSLGFPQPLQWKSKCLQPLVVYPKPLAISPKIPVENATREAAAMKILHHLLALAAVALAMTATKILAKEEDVAKLAIKEKFAYVFGRGRTND